ncbi:PEP-CTERM sorting domain-containing protein [Botrimarina mediterranea]|uniref:PEP-CTERM sorting domain-containing protein n=1 Tax=Botrimarina mediterranea TaxID=2528022 RepID=UPI0011892E72|nr:hypothetical protein K2D_36360 [Planctomycetes bacterium K2D]
MRPLLRTAIVAAASFAVSAPVMAAPFNNLGFEDAAVPANLLPGWTTGGTEVSVHYGDVCLGGACIVVVGGLEGEYGLFLQSGYGAANHFAGVSISQMGDIPSEAKSIRMLSRPDSAFPNSGQFFGWENLRVSINGQDIPLLLLDVTNNVATIGGNLPIGLAGTIAELKVETIAIDDGIERWSNLDGIEFSTFLVPEPSAAFGVLAALVACIVRRHRCVNRRGCAA